MHLVHFAMAASLFAYAYSVTADGGWPWTVDWPYLNSANADSTTLKKLPRYATPTKLPRDHVIPDVDISGEAWREPTRAIRDATPTDTPDADPEIYINTKYITYDIPLHTTVTRFDTTVTLDNFFTLGGTIYPWIHLPKAIRDVAPTDIPDADADVHASPSEPLSTVAKPTLGARAEEAPSDATAQTSKFFPEIVLMSPGASSTGTETLPPAFFEAHSTSTTSSVGSVTNPIDLTQETIITPIEPWWTTSSSGRVGTTLIKVVVTHTDYYDEEPATTSAPTTSSVVTDIGTWTKTVPV